MGNIPFTLQSLPGGTSGIKATLRAMAKVSSVAKRKPDIRQIALRLTRQLPQKNYPLEAKILHSYVRDNIRYVKDIVGIETVQTPEYTLIHGAGDCDDQSVLLATLLESIGHQARFIAVGFNGPLSHVYVQVKLQGQWVGLESTEPWAMGREPPGVTSSITQEIR